MERYNPFGVAGQICRILGKSGRKNAYHGLQTRKKPYFSAKVGEIWLKFCYFWEYVVYYSHKQLRNEVNGSEVEESEGDARHCGIQRGWQYKANMRTENHENKYYAAFPMPVDSD